MSNPIGTGIPILSAVCRRTILTLWIAICSLCSPLKTLSARIPLLLRTQLQYPVTSTKFSVKPPIQRFPQKCLAWRGVAFDGSCFRNEWFCGRKCIVQSDPLPCRKWRQHISSQTLLPENGGLTFLHDRCFVGGDVLHSSSWGGGAI